MVKQNKYMTMLATLLLTINTHGKTIDATGSTTASLEQPQKTVAIKSVYACAQNYDVLYKRSDGTCYVRSGGSRSWRNNNPGCIRYGEFSRKMGAIGQAGGFAIFPCEQTGMKAICALLRTDKYSKKTIFSAIGSYAPAVENNTALYQKLIQKHTGLSGKTIVGTLTDAQLNKLATAIRSIEGWRPGKETCVAQNHGATKDMLAYNTSKVR